MVGATIVIFGFILIVANRPGTRAVIWLSGCPFRCKSCFNKEMQNPHAGRLIPVNELLHWLCSIKGISGLTLSGGEPTEQIPSLIPFLREVRKRTDLSILLFSGRTIEQIASLPEGNTLLSLLDVLIDGPYNPERANPPGTWPSSSNQRIHFLTDRYSVADFSDLPFHEIVITDKGELMESGIFSLFQTAEDGIK
jgi:anaerobic ribonucleoside-triphosphate reductase activating protein